jgi:hypothetical protein
VLNMDIQAQTKPNAVAQAPVNQKPVVANAGMKPAMTTAPATTQTIATPGVKTAEPVEGKSSIVKKWWFWTIIGVAILIIVVGLINLF